MAGKIPVTKTGDEAAHNSLLLIRFSAISVCERCERRLARESRAAEPASGGGAAEPGFDVIVARGVDIVVVVKNVVFGLAYRHEEGMGARLAQWQCTYGLINDTIEVSACELGVVCNKSQVEYCGEQADVHPDALKLFLFDVLYGRAISRPIVIETFFQNSSPVFFCIVRKPQKFGLACSGVVLPFLKTLSLNLEGDSALEIGDIKAFFMPLALPCLKTLDLEFCPNTNDAWSSEIKRQSSTTTVVPVHLLNSSFLPFLST
ncbi:hypothetical protein C8R43DRAFT_1197402 [Mycena crocata]|nr:hypothetical protein C8R43DRAFT_1197402 [Mycena crocata]